MLLKKPIKARYRYTGDTDGFYRTGEDYYLTIEHKRFPKRIEVTCRRGYYDQRYAGSPVIVYTDNKLFDEDWSKDEQTQSLGN
jgi:hypothetical protein